ncbi:MAG: hypothetical protein E7441_08050 [Ruminococcaceae bacterium]|nr:hypothetical protein [Oscillospiraceae bacterium]
MRERLIELLNEANFKKNIIGTGDTADYLLANGVDIPLCKVGCVVYTIEGCINRPEQLVVTAVHQYEKYTSITALSRSRKEYFYEDKDFGEVVFRTREEAEAALVNYESSKNEKGG